MWIHFFRGPEPIGLESVVSFGISLTRYALPGILILIKSMFLSLGRCVCVGCFIERPPQKNIYSLRLSKPLSPDGSSMRWISNIRTNRKESGVKLLYVPGSVAKGMLLAGCVVIAVLIGLIRYITGPELALSLFYLIPVTVAAWHAGRTAGILIACFCALSWLVADLSIQDRFSSPLIPLINELFRLLVFLFVAYLMATMKEAMETHKKTARTDSLTGIPNRLSFLEYTEIEINKSRRNKRPISLIFLDVDNFKTVNDTRGHQEGDVLLSNVAATLTRVIRATDFAARMGGDEFVVLLWRSKNETAFQVAGKIREQLLKMVEQKAWPVTFSLGLITYERVPESVHAMLHEADNLMYQAKQQGKNTIVQKIAENGEELKNN